MMASWQEELSEHNKNNLADLDRLGAKFKQHITEFLNQESKLLVLKTCNLSLGSLRIRQVLKTVKGRYEENDQIFVKWEQLIIIMGPLKMLPKLPNLLVLQFDKPIEENDGEVLSKLLKRLSMSVWKKIVVISSENNFFDNFLQQLDFEISFIKMNDFNVETTSKQLVKVAAMGHLKDVIELLSHEVDINQTDEKKNTALHRAAEAGHRDVVLKLIAYGANKQLKNSGGNTPLHLAARKGHNNVVTVLLENKPSQSRQAIPSDNNINEVNLNKSTALHLAAQGGHRDVVSKLMECGAKHLRNSGGNTPLHLAALKGHDNVLTALLEKKHDQPTRTVLSDDDINETNRDKNTALHLAAQGGHIGAVLALWRRGAQFLPNLQSCTPLHLAAIEGHNVVVAAFLEIGVDVNIQGGDNYTPLHYAAMRGCNDVVLTLIHYGAKIDATSLDDTTPLHLAVLHDHLEIVRTLVESDVSTNSKLLSIKGLSGLTPLEVAKLFEKMTIVEYLAHRECL